MIEEQEDALESKITFEEVAPKLPILADHLNDSEENFSHSLDALASLAAFYLESCVCALGTGE